MTNCKLHGCFSDDEGGAIASIANNENYEFNNRELTWCHAILDGGAIYNDSNTSNYTFNNCKIFKCSSLKDGGFIASMADNENYTFDCTDIDACSVEGRGGFMYVESSNCNILGTESSKFKPLPSYSRLKNTTTISNCSSGADGGAIYTSDRTSCGNKVVIEKLNFIMNFITKTNPDCGCEGSTICVYGDKNCIDSCYLRENRENICETLYAGRICGYTHTQHISIRNCEMDNLHNAHQSAYISSDGVEFDASFNRVFYHGNDKQDIGRYTFDYELIRADD